MESNDQHKSVDRQSRCGRPHTFWLGLCLVLAGLAYVGWMRRPTFGQLTNLAGDRTDKGLSRHSFTEIYDHVFFPLRNRSIKIFEIGIGKGGSLMLWKDYFPQGTVYGIDIIDRSELDSSRVKTFVADQSDREQLQAFLDTHPGAYDILLDDGGHTMEQQQVSFGFLFPHVTPGGYYVIEDVHTSLPEQYTNYGVAEDESNSTLTMINEFIRHGRMKSVYMKPEEMRYIGDHVEYVLLFYRDNSYRSMTCIFRKRTAPKTKDVLDAQ